MPKKKISAREKMLSDHARFMQKYGIDTSRKPRKPTGEVNSIPDYTVFFNAEMSNKVTESGRLILRQMYTGNEIAGIATMHKSNMVPIRRDNLKEAKEVSKMSS